MADGGSSTCNNVCNAHKEVTKENILKKSDRIRERSGSDEKSYAEKNAVNKESFKKRQKDRKIKQVNEADKDLNFLQGGI